MSSPITLSQDEYDLFLKLKEQQKSSLPALPELPIKRDIIQPIAAPSGTTVVSQTLVPQMGSDKKHLLRFEIDMRKFAVLSKSDQVAYMHFTYRGEVDKIRYYAMLTDFMLNSSPSIDGLGRKQVIQTVEASTGGRERGRFVSKPNVLARKLWNRDWREKAESEGATIVE